MNEKEPSGYCWCYRHKVYDDACCPPKPAVREEEWEEEFDARFPVSIDYVRLNENREEQTITPTVMENDRRIKRAAVLREEQKLFIRNKKREWESALEEKHAIVCADNERDAYQEGQDSAIQADSLERDSWIEERTRAAVIDEALSWMEGMREKCNWCDEDGGISKDCWKVNYNKALQDAVAVLQEMRSVTEPGV